MKFVLEITELEGNKCSHLGRLIAYDSDDGKISSVYEQAFNCDTPNAFVNCGRRLLAFADCRRRYLDKE